MRITLNTAFFDLMCILVLLCDLEFRRRSRAIQPILQPGMSFVRTIRRTLAFVIFRPKSEQVSDHGTRTARPDRTPPLHGLANISCLDDLRELGLIMR